MIARALRGALLLASLGMAAACTDSGVIASTPCKKPCDADKLCHPVLAVCVACVHDQDCVAAGHADAPFCDAKKLNCVECRSASDCSGAKPYCVEHKCAASPSDDSSTSSDDRGGSDDHAGAGAGSDDHAAAGIGG